MFPQAISRSFTSKLGKQIRSLLEEPLKELIAEIRKRKEELGLDGLRSDQDFEGFEDVPGLFRSLQTLRENFAEEIRSPRIQAEIERAARLVDAWTRAQVRKQFERNLGFLEGQSAIRAIDITRSRATDQLVTGFGNRAANLIVTMGQDQIDKVEQIVANGVRKGIETNDLIKLINEQTNATEGHARLIARDQIGKISARLTESRQTAAGIPGYIWRTQLNRRVRGNPGGLWPDAINPHWDQEGKFFTWQDGWKAPDGRTLHPGEDFQCQCFAEAATNVSQAPRGAGNT